MREKAAICLGYLCVGEPEFAQRKTVIDGLLNSAGVRKNACLNIAVHYDYYYIVTPVVQVSSVESINQWHTIPKPQSGQRPEGYFTNTERQPVMDKDLQMMCFMFVNVLGEARICNQQ